MINKGKNGKTTYIKNVPGKSNLHWIKNGTPCSHLSPLAGLVTDKCKKTGSSFLQSNSSLLHFTALGAHLGEGPVRGAQFATSPLMHGQLSGNREVFPIIDRRGISTQLIGAHLVLALLLEKGARVLLVSGNDEQHLSALAIAEKRKTKTNRGTLFTCRGPWLKGSCSNWLHLREKIWNWAHCQAFFRNCGLADTFQRGGALQELSTRLIGQKHWHGLPRGIVNPGPPVGQRSALQGKSNFSRGAHGLFLQYRKKPDVILLISSVENAALASEAQAQRIPFLQLADTDFSLVHQRSISTVEKVGSSGVYSLIANSKSISWMFFVSSLLSEGALAGDQLS